MVKQKRFKKVVEWKEADKDLHKIFKLIILTIFYFWLVLSYSIMDFRLWIVVILYSFALLGNQLFRKREVYYVEIKEVKR